MRSTMRLFTCLLLLFGLSCRADSWIAQTIKVDKCNSQERIYLSLKNLYFSCEDTTNEIEPVECLKLFACRHVILQEYNEFGELEIEYHITPDRLEDIQNIQNRYAPLFPSTRD